MQAGSIGNSREFQHKLQRIRDIKINFDSDKPSNAGSLPGSSNEAVVAQDDPNSLEPFFTQINALIEAERFEEALNLIYERRLYLEGDQEAEILKFAQDKVTQVEKMLATAGRFQDIASLYRMVVNLQPDNSWFYLRLAHWLIVAGELGEAEQTLSALVNNVDYQNELQVLRERIVQSREAEGKVAIGVPLEKKGDQFSVLVDIDGASARLMIDTGASMTVIKEAFVQQSGVADGVELRPMTMNSAGGQIQGFAFSAPYFRVGSAILDDIEVGVMELPNFQYDGLLGMNVLSEFRFYIDQQASLLFLE